MIRKSNKSKTKSAVGNGKESMNSDFRIPPVSANSSYTSYLYVYCILHT